MVELRGGEVAAAQHVWVDVRPAPDAHAHGICSTSSGDDGARKRQGSLSHPQGIEGQQGCDDGAATTRGQVVGDRWRCRTIAHEGLVRTDSESGGVLVRSAFDAHEQE